MSLQLSSFAYKLAVLMDVAMIACKTADLHASDINSPIVSVNFSSAIMVLLSSIAVYSEIASCNDCDYSSQGMSMCCSMILFFIFTFTLLLLS